MSAAPDEEERARVVEILAPVAVDSTYSYLAPAAMQLSPGDSVTAPLGRREAYGVVWSIDGDSGPGGNLKTVSARLDRPPLSQKLRSFIDWLARYTLTPRGMALRLATRAAEDAGPEATRTLYRASGNVPERLTPTRARVLKAAEGGVAFAKKALAEAAACSTGVIDALVDEGALEAIAAPPEPIAPPLDPLFAAPALEPAQQNAADALKASLSPRAFKPFLLEGVTGSGKTEVYFEAIAEALKAGGQALVMMPEIALTTQFLERFADRFGEKPAEWHSGVGARKRARIWRGCATGEVRVVVGARSALFLPFSDLRLIVVDEEHEGAYKQDDGVSYHARDMAVVRARIEEASIILASATPSIETRVNAMRGRYGYLRLDSRARARLMPTLEAIDMRKEGPPRGRWIAPRLALAVGEAIARREQALLFLNRRGYAPLTVCRTCGHRFRCEQCDAWLVEHRFRRALMCHHCGHIERRPNLCPECGAEDSLAACGPGVERLAEEAATLFPDARILVLSSDFPGGADRLRRELEEIAKGAFDIVIGTQLVAKGHNFPFLTLVGVIDADLGLGSGDPRAAERTFQLLNQVTGRAGRGDRPGHALIQTFHPAHPVIAALLSGDAEKFYEQEIAIRERAGLPPFGRLAAMIVSAKDAATAEAHARALARAAHELPPSPRYRIAAPGAWPEQNEIALLGPAEAPIALIRGRYRFRLLAKGPRGADMQAFLRDMLAAGPKERGGVRVQIDVDPQNFS
ncbi:primosomal protein N' [Methylocystis sp. L43]|jgi:primosomal protein N' (replication factor Y)|uniref:primosomal protein N' n=1 Tax=unclassified Methylocystis TaxID=2625913 RepID=UPI0018C33E9D|nr:MULTISPECIES: primosomal protein N' [unclassified Methylocystis]MBG0798365.1 primosomal protein N' [Methylocystis sp. L43]MBG0805839.1 primosomal protein N' [Methylocystis sp. H15]